MPIVKSTPTPNTRQVEGDDGYIAMMMLEDRGLIPRGYYYLGINKRTGGGPAATRRGTLHPIFANNAAYGSIVGDGVYANPNGAEVLLVATPRVVYVVRDGNSPGTVAIPVDVTLERPCEFVQAFDKVLLFRGPDHITLEWDGLSVEGFVPVTKSKTDPVFVDVIPNAETAESYKDRLIVPFDRDRIAVSDINDYSIYDKDLANFRINNGTSDKLVRVFSFGNSLVMFKERSKIVFSNSSSDATQVTQDPLSRTIGLWARRSVQEVGDVVLYLSNPGGVYALRHAPASDRLMDSAIPWGAKEIDGKVVNPIAPLIRRINWAAAGNAVSAVLGDYYYLAVPIDGSPTNNAILVGNSVSEGWEGYDTWASPMNISSLRVTLYGGALRVFALDHTANAIYVLYEGKSDFLAAGEYQVRDRFETRGYAEIPETGPGHKATRKAMVSLATWNPSYTVTALTDGVNEEIPLTAAPATKDRRKYLTFGRLPFVVTNVNGDFNEPQREDYSAPLAAPGIYLGDGIALEQRQEILEPYVLRGRGRWTSLRIENTQGSCDVMGTSVESAATPLSYRRAA